MVFYEDWQMQCCGIPFKIGDRIKWLVEIGHCLNSPVDIGKLDYIYEEHSHKWTELLVLEGKVCRIQALYQRYEYVEPGSPFMEPKDGFLVEVTQADGWDGSINGNKFSGYMVTIGDHTIRPALEEEVEK